jgi:peptidoglycan/LPS O-acetylase OafA/YrhL
MAGQGQPRDVAAGHEERQLATGPRRNFAALEGWRGVSAFIVALSHFGHGVVWHLSGSAFLLNAYLLVDFFFVLSGFVIAHAYGERLADAADVAAFALRRIGRLWPLHVSVLAVWLLTQLVQLAVSPLAGGLAAHAAFSDGRSPIGFIATLFLVQGFGDWQAYGWNFPSWSIWVELWTCFLFGLVCLAPRRQRLHLFLLLSAAGFAALLLHGGMRAFLGFGFFRGLYGFFLGTLVYRIYSMRADRTLRGGGLLEAGSVTLAALFVIFCGATTSALAAPLVFALVVYVFAFEEGPISRLLKTWPLARLGRWSYSVYLNHYLLLLLFVAGLRHVHRLLGAPLAGTEPLDLGNLYFADLLCLAYAALAIAISAGTFRWIEEPWRRRFNGWADRLRPLRRTADRSAAARV